MNSDNQKRTLYIFRHGLTDWNQQRRLQGHSDIPLNEEGRNQARSLIPFFKDNPVEKVFSSDLVRAVETAHLATGAAHIDIIKNFHFREAHLGQVEGLHEDQIVLQFGEESLEKWRSWDVAHRTYALPGGESREQCNQRFHKALVEICNSHDFSVAAICSHGFVLRRLFHFLSNETIIPPMIANCIVFKVTFDKVTQQFEVHL